MRVLLVYPPISREERYSSAIGHAGGRQIPLGVYYLAASVRAVGHEPSVIDAEARNLTAADVVRLACEFRPGLIGISSTTVAYHRSVELARALKHEFPNLPIALGGPHISANPRHAMSCESFDYGVLGEGEITLCALVDALESGSAVEGLPGLVLRRECEAVVNAKREYVADLDSLPPPAYDLIPDMSVYNPPPTNYRKLPAINIITSRGCPSQCTFCDRSVFGRELRMRSPENVASEIATLQDTYGVREIAFVDDTFTLKPSRIRRLLELLEERHRRFPWTCMSRTNTVDRDLLGFMHDHGCWNVSFGIESGDEDILRAIKKFTSLDQARRVIGWCRELGIRTKGFFMIGHPGETVATIERTIDFGLSLPLDDIVATINTPIPGSDQYREADRYGRLDRTDWSRFNYWRPVFVPHGLSEDTLVAKHREFYRRFYLRPRIVWRYFLGFFASGGLRRLAALVRSLPFLVTRKGARGSGV